MAGLRKEDEWAADYLRALHEATKQEASERGVRIAAVDLEFMTHLLPDLFLNLPRQEVLIAPYPGDRNAVMGIHRRSRSPGFRSVPSISAKQMGEFETPNGNPPFVMVLHQDLHKSGDKKGLVSRSRFYLNVYAAERSFHRNLGRVADLMEAHKVLGSRALVALELPARRTQIEAACILLVSCLENFLRDAFLAYRHLWFAHLPNPAERSRHALKSARELGTHPDVVDRAIATGVPASQALAEELSSMGRLPINFQSLTGNKSGYWAYKSFFGIDLAELPLAKTEAPNYWAKVKDLLSRRHDLVHSVHESPYPRTQLRTEVRLVYAMEKSVMTALMQEDARQ